MAVKYLVTPNGNIPIIVNTSLYNQITQASGAFVTVGTQEQIIANLPSDYKSLPVVFPRIYGDDYRNFVSASSSILDSFGRRVKPIIYEDIAAPSNLTAAAQNDLQTLVKQALTFNIGAIDLSLIDVDYTPIRPGQYFKVKSAPHGINDFFQCSEITLDLLNPEQNNYTFGPALQTLTKFLNS